MKAPASESLTEQLANLNVPYDVQTETGSAEGSPILDTLKQEQFEAVKRWFYHDWRRSEPKLRTSIVEGISVFLSLFDDNPQVKYMTPR